MEHPYTFPFETKDEVTEAGVFSGYASVFDVKIPHPFFGVDIVKPGAFSQTLHDKGLRGIKMLWQHQTDSVIGKWLDLAEDRKGLYCKGQLFLQLPKAHEAYVLMKERALDGLSIGFSAHDRNNEWDAQKQTRSLHRVDLFEISPVTFPAQVSAKINSVKSLDTVRDIDNIRDYERFLRAVGFNTKEARQLASAGWSALRRDVAAAADAQPVTGLVTALRDARSALRRPLFEGDRNARNGPRGHTE